MKKPSETDLVRACLQLLKLRGVFAWRNNTGGRSWTDKRGTERFMRYGVVGSPDIIGVLPDGRFLGVECKLPGGKQSLKQRMFEASVLQKGGAYWLVCSVAYLEELLDIAAAPASA